MIFSIGKQNFSDQIEECKDRDNDFIAQSGIPPNRSEDRSEREILKCSIKRAFRHFGVALFGLGNKFVHRIFSRDYNPLFDLTFHSSCQISYYFFGLYQEAVIEEFFQIIGNNIDIHQK